MSSVLLVCKQNDVVKGLAEIVRPMNFQLIDSAASAAEGRRRLLEVDYDMVIVNTPLGDEFGVDFAIDTLEKMTVGMILIVKSELVDHVEEKLMDTTAFVVAKPLNRQLLVQNVRFVLASREKIQRLENKNTELKEKIDDMAAVYRGKLCLMGYLDMSEADAHRYIQKKAMDTRQSPRKVAEQIIKTYGKKK